MPRSQSFSRQDIPRADRVVEAEVADVYAALEAIEQWSTWIPDVESPVVVVSPEVFDVVWHADDGTTNHRRIDVAAKGPTVTLFLDVSSGWKMNFRTTPHPLGTHVEVVAEPPSESRWARIGTRRNLTQFSANLLRMLDQLAAHVEGAAQPPSSS